MPSVLPKRLYLFVGLAGAILSAVLWLMVLEREKRHIEQLTVIELNSLENTLQEAIKTQIEALQRLTSRWEVRGGTPWEEWRVDAANYIDDHPGLAALGWADASLRARWIVPEVYSESIQDLNLAFEQHRRTTLERARDTREAVRTRSIDLKLGWRGFTVYFPLYTGERFDGMIVAVYHTERLFDAIVAPHFDNGLSVAVYELGENIYSRRHDGTAEAARWMQHREVTVGGVTLQLQVTPGPSMWAEMRSALPEIALTAGLIFSFLLMTSVRLWERALYYLHATERQNLHLLEEIDERKRAVEESEQLAESLRRQTEELESANKELAAFSYSISHDLRAPLRGMDGFSQALLEDYGDQLDDTARDYLGRIRRASQRMADLIDAILTLSRATQGELRRRKVDLSALAEGVVEELRYTAPERDVQISVQSGIEVVGDERMLRVALQNLLGNAWKFTARCDSPDIAFGTTERDGKTVYYVQDNGAGFNMTYADRLFTAFQRLHRSDEFEGTGIGLASVRRIINRHGGDVWAESRPGEGATFYFTL
jgi:signal transduction histidine kinase